MRAGRIIGSTSIGFSPFGVCFLLAEELSIVGELNCCRNAAVFFGTVLTFIPLLVGVLLLLAFDLSTLGDRLESRGLAKLCDGEES